MSCSHLNDFKKAFGLESYEIIQNTIISQKKNSIVRTEGLISCFDCDYFNNNCRLMACLHCVYFGCYDKHIRSHSASRSHHLSVELSNGHIICNTCQDVVYDSDVDEIIAANFESRSDAHYNSWKPTAFECKLLREHPKRIKVEKFSGIGMRGLMNMGNTCYMNCVVQSLLHTPILRDYFFSEKHLCSLKDRKECLCCHFTTVYQRYYSDDDPAAISLHEMLHMIWQNDPSLSKKESEYTQKDAHEFFFSLRNLLQRFSLPRDATHDEKCRCIVDSLFRGTLQSDVVCSVCSNVSTTIEPLWEIQLDIPEPPASAALVDCLYSFTRPEPLSKIVCAVCESPQEVTKQLTFKVLPLVIVIHMKRFKTEQYFVKEQIYYRSSKKSRIVSFPMDLDMSPYLSNQRNKSNTGSNQSNFCDSKYTLYSVIVHSGDLTGGHYRAFIRRTGDIWFKCDDMSVEPAEVEEVLQSESYLLFYHKTILPYE